MAGQQADSAAFHLASPDPRSSQYLCLDRPHPRGWEGSGRVHSRAILAFLWNPFSGATPYEKKYWGGTLALQNLPFVTCHAHVDPTLTPPVRR